MSEATKSMTIKILIALLSSLATALHLQGGNALIPAIATDGVDLAVALYGWYRASGMKLVPHDSVSIKPLSSDGVAAGSNVIAPGDHVAFKTVGGANVTARVVGTLLFAFLIFGNSHDARAQTILTTSGVSTQLTSAETQLYAALNTIIGFVGGFVQADLQAAIADAQAQTPPNTQAAACWQAIAKIPVTTIPTGAGLAFLKQKFIDLQMLYVPLNTNCGSIAPLFLKGYNQFMSLAASQNL